MKKIPECPIELPTNIGRIVRELGGLWAAAEVCPKINYQSKLAWQQLLNQWLADTSLPLLIRKSSLVRGSEIIHETGRAIIPTDNSPAQWACNLALRNITPTLSEIKNLFEKDELPVAFTHKREEKNKRKYHCMLGAYTVNKAGWKLCHIRAVGLNGRSLLSSMKIEELEKAFYDLLNPSNYFLLPMQWGGLGEANEFIEGYLNFNPASR